jgi:hypothetical protein
VVKYLWIAAAVAVVALLTALVARAGEGALGFGRQLESLEGLTGGAQTLRLNGEALQLAATNVDQSLDEVMDGLRAECRGATHELLGSAWDQIFHQTDTEGMVACLVPEAGSTLLERLQRFADTQDLAALGSLRYLYARRTPAGRTHVVAAWTERSFRIDRVIPPDGSDPPGVDPEGAGRPPRSSRLLQAEVEGAPHRLWIYASADEPDAALDAYGAELSRRGWQRVALSEERVRSYRRPGIDLLITANESDRGSEIGIVESR